MNNRVVGPYKLSLFVMHFWPAPHRTKAFSRVEASPALLTITEFVVVAGRIYVDPLEVRVNG